MYQDPNYIELVSHIPSCPYLGQGLYHCPYCNKEESFDWEMSYSFPKQPPSTEPTSISYDATFSSLSRQTQGTAPVQTYQAPYIDVVEDTYPQATLHSQRQSASPIPNTYETGKRKFEQYTAAADDGFVHLHSAAAAGDVSYAGETSLNSNYDVGGLVNLSTSDVSQQQSGIHLSPHLERQQTSPQLGHGAFGANLDAYGVHTGLIERRHSSIIASDYSGSSAAGRAMAGTQQRVHRHISPAPTRARSRSMARSIVASQNAVQSNTSAQLDVTSTLIKPQAGGGVSDAGPEPGAATSSAATADAEKGSVTCQQCGKVLRGKVAWLPSNLQRHMREIHLSAPKTECRICGRTFNRGHNLRHHMKAVHGEQS